MLQCTSSCKLATRDSFKMLNLLEDTKTKNNISRFSPEILEN